MDYRSNLKYTSSKMDYSKAIEFCDKITKRLGQSNISVDLEIFLIIMVNEKKMLHS